MSKGSDEIQDMLDLIDIEDYLNYESIDYRMTRGRSGVQLNLKECPRCGGTGWKVYLNAETGLGSCFHGACAGEPGFNVYSFVYHREGKNHAETVGSIKRYVKTLGWRPKVKTQAPLDHNPDEIQVPKSVQLPIQGKTLKYLSDRGFGPDMAEYFGWRFSKDGEYAYTLHGEVKKQNWANRVIIPVFSIDGELVTFQGRSIEKDPFQKYLFPPGLAGAGRFIYNAHNARGLKEIVLNEGAFDVAATKKAFDEDITFQDIGICGSFGKHLSMAASGDQDDQLSDLKKMRDLGLKEITMMWDGSYDAIRDAIAAGMKLRGYGFTVKLAVLPVDKDPNEVPTEVVRKSYLEAVVLTPLTAAKLMTKYSFTK